MAYASVTSLKHTIHSLLNSSHISIVPPFPEILKSLYKEVESLQENLGSLDSSSNSGRVNYLEGEITGAVRTLEDLLESHVSNQFLLQSESLGDKNYPALFSPDLQALKQDVDSFTHMVKEMNEDDAGFFRRKSRMVGSRDEILNVMDMLTGWSSKLELLSLVGMVGIGKTTLAMEVFENLLIWHHFDRRAWVTVGMECQLEEIPRAILDQLDHEYDNKMLVDGDHEKIEKLLFQSLYGRRYLIVLDDVWDNKVWHYLKKLLPENNNGSRVMLTTRIREVALPSPYIFSMKFLNMEESWHLLREKVFAELFCPPQLEKAGKKIAKNCEGLPLAIVTMADLLSKAEKTPEYWNKIAANRENSLVIDVYDQTKIYKFTKGLQLSNSFPDDDNVASSTTDLGRKKSEMVELSDEKKIKVMLLEGWRSCKLGIVSLVGMAGIGKTTLARKVSEDPSISRYFDFGVWVSIGPKYQLKEILLGILAQVNPDIDINKMFWQGTQDLASDLRKHLMGMKYLIVLDDIWNTQVWNDLKMSFPDDNNGSRVLLTTRLEEVARYAKNSTVHHKHFLNEEESWNLLRQKVFGEGSYDSQLVKVGKEIAKNCDGLPLTVVTVADLLSKAEKTPDYWNKVADKRSSVFKNAYALMAKVLYPSYEYLPPYLKACFLYMGVFPQNYYIPYSKLTKLWSTEGFLEPDPPNSFEDFSAKCLKELASRSLLMVGQKNYNDQIKTCRLHSAFWHLCVTEARKNQFFHILDSHVDSLAKGINSQRRLCIHNNILFGIKHVYDAMASTSTARSLLCTGPHHQYPVPVCFSLMMLRVLDALTIYFYEFPFEVVKLARLRYLAFTYNGKLHGSISKLLNLECLIVHRCLRIKIPKDWEYLPMEIWDMKELKHLQIMGSNLPDPCGASLPNLLTLLDVSPQSCTQLVLQSLPNLKKLGIRIELSHDSIEPLHCFDHISCLHKLKSLQCTVVNPEFKFAVVALPTSLPIFPSGLEKLRFSGLGYPWNYMSIIGLLPNLQVLKLGSYAFRGPKWETHAGEFKQLSYLLLEDTDLVYWRAGDGCFPDLKQVIIRHCYKLKEIPSQIVSGSCKIELVDCNPSASKQMEKDQKVI